MGSLTGQDRTSDGPIESRQPASRRIVGLDVARAVAVFGMFGAHVGVVAADVDASPSTWLGAVNGRSSILFAVLAGVSVALLSGRTVPLDGGAMERARVRLGVRAAWVFVIGYLLEALGTDIDVILGVYAVLFVLALPFLRWRPRWLVVAAAAVALLSPVTVGLLAQWADDSDAEAVPIVARVVDLVVTGAYPALIWWTFILVGLAVGRSDLGSARGRRTLAVTGAGLAVVGYSGGWLSTQWWAGGISASLAEDEDHEHSDAWDLTRLSGASPHTGTTFEIVGSVGVALLVIAACLVLADRLPAMTSPLAAVGSMALTVYTAQVVSVWALGNPEYDDNWPWLLYILASLAVATLWKRFVGRGPLERLLTWSSAMAARQVTRQ